MNCKECDREITGNRCPCGWYIPVKQFVKTQKLEYRRVPVNEWPEWELYPEAERAEIKKNLREIWVNAPKGNCTKKEKSNYWLDVMRKTLAQGEIKKSLNKRSWLNLKADPVGSGG